MWLLQVLQTYKPDVCIIEEPPYVRNFRSYKVLCIYLGCAMTTIASLGEYAPRVVIANNKWAKKELLGNGNASKEDVMKHVVEVFNLKSSITQDEADACLYALLGR